MRLASQSESGGEDRPRQAADLLAQAKQDYRNQRFLICLDRCEILARASTGEFRGACCEIEGKDSCKGIEVLHYKDATAGKKGPFALMMHNPGLFDEFKDFWVEIDPVGDELVTMK